jgi:hypothetical protein
MAKARKEGKPNRNRKNLSKKLTRINNNKAIIDKIYSEMIKSS